MKQLEASITALRLEHGSLSTAAIRSPSRMTGTAILNPVPQHDVAAAEDDHPGMPSAPPTPLESRPIQSTCT